jgi:hypothetical protein
MKILMPGIAALLLSLASMAFADPNMSLLADGEWKADCNKVINETGAEPKKQSYKRLRSTYFLQGEELIWKVQSFSDEKCKKIFDENKYVSKCKWTAEDEYAQCEQTKWEFSKDQKNWQSKPMVDYTGNSNVLKMKVKALELKNKNIQLTTIGESEEPSVEVLTK